MAVSRQIARQLGVRWFSIDINPDQVRREWFSTDGDNFMSAVWGGTSLPHVQDWFALRKIRRESLLDDDAIILPGHTVVGNMHNPELLQNIPTKAEIAQAIWSHSSLQVPPSRTLKTNRAFQKAVTDAFKQVGYDRGPDSLQAALEWFNLRERQAKYINNSMRNYEFFGWDWALPMCSALAIEAWRLGGQPLTATRQWYQSFTDQVFAEVSPDRVAYHSAPSIRVPAPVKRVLLKGTQLTRMDRALSRTRSVHAMLHHPMGFEGFIREPSRLSTVLQLECGQTTMGLWADSFLHNRWGSPLCEIVPPVAEERRPFRP